MEWEAAVRGIRPERLAPALARRFDIGRSVEDEPDIALAADRPDVGAAQHSAGRAVDGRDAVPPDRVEQCAQKPPVPSVLPRFTKMVSNSA